MNATDAKTRNLLDSKPIYWWGALTKRWAKTLKQSRLPDWISHTLAASYTIVSQCMSAKKSGATADQVVSKLSGQSRNSLAKNTRSNTNLNKQNKRTCKLFIQNLETCLFKTRHSAKTMPTLQVRCLFKQTHLNVSVASWPIAQPLAAANATKCWSRKEIPGVAKHLVN